MKADAIPTFIAQKWFRPVHSEDIVENNAANGKIGHEDKREEKCVTDEMLQFYIVLAAVFSILAALCAFIITHGEYLRHFPDKKRPLKMAAKMSLAAFAFFMLVSVLLLVIINLF